MSMKAFICKSAKTDAAIGDVWDDMAYECMYVCVCIHVRLHKYTAYSLV